MALKYYFNRALAAITIALSCVAISCSNVMEDAMFNRPNDSALLNLFAPGPELPAVTAVAPANAATSVATNSIVQAAFNRDMDPATFDADSFIITDGTAALSGDISHIGTTATFRPSSNLMPDTEYTAIISGSVADQTGLKLKKRYVWTFKTASAPDFTSPEVSETSPINGATNISVNTYIAVSFNEAIDLSTINASTMAVMGSEGAVAGSFAFANDAAGATVTFHPEINLLYEGAYSVVLATDIKDLAGNPLADIPAWVFTCDPLAPYLLVWPVDTGNDNDGDYEFFAFDKPLMDNRGRALVEGVDYTYGEPLNSGGHDIFDASANGPFASGKYFRIVHDGINITSAPLNVTPLATVISDDVVSSPPGNICYIDPVNAKFVLPRPSYWSRMENDTSVTNPEIKEEDPVWLPTGYNTSGSKFVTGGKWNYCYYTDTSSWGNRHNVLKPFGSNYTSMSRGTVSVWIKAGNATLYNNCIAYESAWIELTADEASIYVPALTDPITAPINLQASFHHVYIVWDVDGLGDGDGSTIMVYVDGGLVLKTSYSWEAGEFYQEFVAWGFAGGFYVDNIKIWKHVVSLDPSWEYNGGYGRENALHIIYGPYPHTPEVNPNPDSENDYRPRLSIDGAGVGFYVTQ